MSNMRHRKILAERENELQALLGRLGPEPGLPHPSTGRPGLPHPNTGRPGLPSALKPATPLPDALTVVKREREYIMCLFLHQTFMSSAGPLYFSFLLL